jgi:hypothetical protein
MRSIAFPLGLALVTLAGCATRTAGPTALPATPPSPGQVQPPPVPTVPATGTPTARATDAPARERPAVLPCPWPQPAAPVGAAAQDTTRRWVPPCAPPEWKPPAALIPYTPPPVPDDRPRAIVDDYLKYVVTAPTPEIIARFSLDTTYYKKYADANGYPIIASGKVSDAALAIVRDQVNYMLAYRPDIREAMIAAKGRIGIMAETEYTMTIPEQRNWRVPMYLDPRLTVQERARYYEPNGMASMTAERYWNPRARHGWHFHDVCRRERARAVRHAVLGHEHLRARVLARHHGGGDRQCRSEMVPGHCRFVQGRQGRLRSRWTAEPAHGARLRRQYVQ